jgi:hypothetical protein
VVTGVKATSFRAKAVERVVHALGDAACARGRPVGRVLAPGLGAERSVSVLRRLMRRALARRAAGPGVFSVLGLAALFMYRKFGEREHGSW